jgi:hypothetical protein
VAIDRQETVDPTSEGTGGQQAAEAPADGVVAITPAQVGYMLEGIDWRHPQRRWRPTVAG